MSTNTTAIPPAASFNYYSQLYAGVSLKQLNMAVISTLAVLVIIIVFLTILRARRGFRFHTPLPVTHLRAVGSRGLFMDPRFNGSRGLDPALISTVGRSYAYDGLEADDSREKEEAPTKDSEGHRLLLVGKECVVCLAEYRVGETLKMLHACGHSFHEECINAWLAGNQSCPVCRTALVTEPEGPPAELPVGETHLGSSAVALEQVVIDSSNDHHMPAAPAPPHPLTREEV